MRRAAPGRSVLRVVSAHLWTQRSQHANADLYVRRVLVLAHVVVVSRASRGSASNERVGVTTDKSNLLSECASPGLLAFGDASRSDVARPSRRGILWTYASTLL